MVDVIYRQIKLVIMLFHFATELRPSVGQYSQHRRPETRQNGRTDHSDQPQ
jgi:hypothetical protein